MMKRQAIRQLSSDKKVPPRLFDLLIDEDTGEAIFEIKVGPNHTEREKWEVIRMQIDLAMNQRNISA